MSKGDPKQPVSLSPNGADDYADRIAAAKTGHVPVGGVPMPDMPRFDQPPEGAPRDRGMGVQQAQAQQARAQQAQHNLKTMSPEQYAQAVQTGQAVQGVGGAYYSNQPSPGTPPPPSQEIAPPDAPQELRGEDGQPVNPPRPGGAGLSEETVAQLEKAAKESGKEDEEDDEYFESLRNATDDILSNKKRREAIENKIPDELNFEDLIIHQEIRQEVPILKTFRPTFRTPSGDEDLFVKRLIGEESGSERYIIDKYAIMGLCCGLYALNGKPLPSHLDKDNLPDNDLFEKKFKVLMKYPLVLLADMSANFTWFTERVQNLLSLDKVRDF